MLDIAWPEFLIIGAVALVVIGPKDLPKVMQKMGKAVGVVRRMAQDMRHTIDQLDYEAQMVDRLKTEKEGDGKKAPVVKDEVKDDGPHG